MGRAIDSLDLSSARSILTDSVDGWKSGFDSLSESTVADTDGQSSYLTDPIDWLGLTLPIGYGSRLGLSVEDDVLIG